MNEKKISQFEENLKIYALGGLSLNEAYEKFRLDQVENYEGKFLLELEQARKNLNTRSIKSLNYAKTISSKKQEDWFFGPQEFHQNWHAYKNYLLKVKNRSKDVIDLLDEESSIVVNQLLNPKYKGDKRIQGLVLGYVQSGKTANMAGVIAKAADTGYKLIIVLAGLTDALREQTQERIQNDILNHNEMIWHPLTDKESDISASTDKIPISSEKTTLCVIKKRVQIVERLITKMNKLPKPDLNAPTLIIDDECDQASLNTKEYKNDADEISITNRLLKKLLSDFKNVTYVGYTATPNAPFLTHPDSPDGLQSLYPSDFITALEEPKDYFGVNKLFGTESNEEDASLPFIKRILDEELSKLNCPRKLIPNFKPELTSSLQNACDYYLLCLAARKFRGLGSDHCCMMIHVSRSKIMHESYRKLIKKEWLEPVKNSLKNNETELILRLKKLWVKEAKVINESVRNNLNCPKSIESFDQIQKYLLDAIDNLMIIVENSDEINANNRLKFRDKTEDDFETVHAIVIGGDVLSRGLTIEGLVSSFFLRVSKQDDTLMQMGRWFGYRKGYEDLPRIWMTSDVELDFTKFVESENFYRSQINLLNSQGRKPSDFPIVVRQFDNRNPTSKGKISKRVISSNGTFYGREIWTLRFALDQKINQNNKTKIDELINNIQNANKKFEENGKNYVIKNVEFKPILKFLRDYNFYDKEIFKKVIDFIESDIDNDQKSYFKNWNISIKGGDGAEFIQIGNLNVYACQRSKIENGSVDDDLKLINLKSLMGSEDLYADVDARAVQVWKKSEEYLRFKKQKRAASRKCRENIYGYRPLLIIYPITKNSEPKTSARFKLFERTTPTELQRQNLNYEPHDLFGLVVAFPNPPGKIFNKQDLVLDI